MNKEEMIRKYLGLALSKLERDLTSEEVKEMSRIMTELEMTHDEIIVAGTSLIVH